MNKQDQERLLELKLRVYAKVASQFINPDNDPDDNNDSTVIYESNIEGNKGRIDKAVRMLKEAGVIEKLKSKIPDVTYYKVLKFDEAKALGIKPEFDLFWRNHIGDVSNGMYIEIDTGEEAIQESLDIEDTTNDNLKDIGYKSFQGVQ